MPGKAPIYPSGAIRGSVKDISMQSKGKTAELTTELCMLFLYFTSIMSQLHSQDASSTQSSSHAVTLPLHICTVLCFRLLVHHFSHLISLMNCYVLSCLLYSQFCGHFELNNFTEIQSSTNYTVAIFK